jgi:anti-sigma regulatory factor (Ser/Thr protein kinase)
VTSVSSQRRPGEAPVLSLALAHNRQAPSLARAAIAGFSEDREIGETTRATLTLLISEVVTNAVIHPDAEPPSDIRLRARIADGVMRVEVTDQGSGFEPTPRDATRSDRGYGLYLLDKQAMRWGVERRGGTTVWFELTLKVD